MEIYIKNSKSSTITKNKISKMNYGSYLKNSKNYKINKNYFKRNYKNIKKA